jgi:hypothetical protein
VFFTCEKHSTLLQRNCKLHKNFCRNHLASIRLGCFLFVKNTPAYCKEIDNYRKPFAPVTSPVLAYGVVKNTPAYCKEIVNYRKRFAALTL